MKQVHNSQKMLGIESNLFHNPRPERFFSLQKMLFREYNFQSSGIFEEQEKPVLAKVLQNL